jgi:hypothetical protein
LTNQQNEISEKGALIFHLSNGSGIHKQIMATLSSPAKVRRSSSNWLVASLLPAADDTAAAAHIAIALF